MSHFNDLPEPPPELEAGIPSYEYYVHAIKSNEVFWDEVDSLLELRAEKSRNYYFFKDKLAEYLIGTLYWGPPRVGGVSEYERQKLRYNDLASLINGLDKTLKKIDLIKGDLESIYLQKDSHDDGEECKSNSMFPAVDLDAIEQSKQPYKKLKEDLRLARKVAAGQRSSLRKKDLWHVSYKEMNKFIMHELAEYIGEGMLSIGVAPTTSKDGIFEHLFSLCCQVMGLKEPKPGNVYVSKACRILRSKNA